MAAVLSLSADPPSTTSADERIGAPENRRLAAKLSEYADLLEQQVANPFRVLAYRKAAASLEGLATPVSEILAAHGRQGLDDLPAIGPRTAAAISEMVQTGRWSQLERLRGHAHPEDLFRTIPGIGPELARRLAEDLHLSSLESLELAVYDGRLAATTGWGPRRVEMVKSALAERLGSLRRRRFREGLDRPPLPMILDVDREYREAAVAGRLSTVAPRRFNPAGEAWLPILHTERGDWRFTALFSNTATAHKLGRTRDWVVIYFEKDAVPEGQCTVVTETHGALKGRRVVRGREAEASAPER